MIRETIGMEKGFPTHDWSKLCAYTIKQALNVNFLFMQRMIMICIVIECITC